MNDWISAGTSSADARAPANAAPVARTHRNSHPRRFRSGLGIFPSLLCALLLSQPTAANEQFEELRRLVEQGQPQAAYALAQQNLERDEGDPTFDFYYGMAAIDSGHLGEGVFALERVLMAQPSHHRARLELARGYFLLGDDERARREFETVLSQNPPPGVRATVNQHLTAITKRDPTVSTSLGGYVELGLGYDTNANSAPTDALIPTPIGLLPLPDSSLETGDAFGMLALGGNVQHPVAAGQALYGQVDTFARFYESEGEFSHGSVSANGGYQWQMDQNRFRVGMQLQRFVLDGDTNRDLIGLGGEWRHAADDNTLFTTFVTSGRLHYPGQTIRDSWLHIVGGGVVHAVRSPSTPVLFASAYVGHEDSIEDSDAARAIAERNFGGVRVGAQTVLMPSLLMHGSLLAQHSRFGADYAMFQTTRTDNYYAAELGLTQVWSENWSLRGVVSYSGNASNIDIFDYNRTQTQLVLRRDFR